jgi:hypothetical protein
MNPEIKAQWVSDLRSGEYEQGKGALNRNGKLCCLGVLCEQAVKAGVISKVVDGAAVYYGDWNEESVLPAVLLEWAGLPVTGVHPNNPRVTLDDTREASLAELNDGEKYGEHSFDQIADLIDAQL